MAYLIRYLRLSKLFNLVPGISNNIGGLVVRPQKLSVVSPTHSGQSKIPRAIVSTGTYLSSVVVYMQLVYSNIDLCYRIQYPMPNNRDWGDPFSIRQTAVYQAHFDTEQPDTWILIRPTTAVQRRLFADLERSIASCRRKDPVCYHVNFLSSTTAFWEDYIEYLRDRLDQYVSDSIQLDQRKLKKKSLSANPFAFHELAGTSSILNPITKSPSRTVRIWSIFKANMHA